MAPRECALLILLAASVGCAGGSTVRVASEDETAGAPPVSLAPAPVADSAQLSEPAGAAEPAEAEAQGYEPYAAAGDLEIGRVGQWARTGIGEARRLVIRNANGFAELWSELGVGDRPEVDFTRNLVVVAAAGPRPSGGYEIAIERVTQEDGQLAIHVVETVPGPNCVTTGAEARPVDVVVVPAVAARGWSFMERKEIRACR